MNGIGRKLVGQWNTKTVVGVALGAILMAIMMVYIQIPIFTQVQFSLAPVVIVIVGALFGPLPAAIPACFGNKLSHRNGGRGFWLDRTIGHFFCGFITGLLPVYGARVGEGVFTNKQAATFAVLAFVAPLIAFCGITPLFTMMWYQGELEIGMVQGVIAGVKDGLMAAIIGVPLLKMMAKKNRLKTNLTEE